MALQIKWTVSALSDYEQIIIYLAQEWSEAIAQKFIDIVRERLETLSHFPYLGIASEKVPFIRSILLTKHNRLYYRIQNTSIEILGIFDIRQDPEKNPLV
jgi:plasmid stabilization system protein ParE